MAFVSTRDKDGRRFSLAEALRLGPAPDGGLFMPERLEPLPESFFATLAGRPLQELASDVLERLVDGDLPRPAVEELVASALDFPLPLVELEEDLKVLELFHGPTLAFKDVGARFLARLLPLSFRKGEPEGRSPSDFLGSPSSPVFGRGGQGGEGPSSEILVLVATSGDTGGAVAQAFQGVAGTRVAVLYPRGKVSPRQERQFATLGGNVRAFAVDGVFDDCQRLVKQAFADRQLAASLGLTSANSINVGRLLPQAIYYFAAAAQLSREELEKPPLFVVPSGNFGNLSAGLLAKRLGLPARFLAATNENDVVPEYLDSGVYRPRPSVATLSNAMDVGEPNNFARILHLYANDRDALRKDVEGERVSDDETLATLKRYQQKRGYLADPHTAVGLAAAEKALVRHPGTIAIVLATAHPAKFAEAVEPALGRVLPLPEALAKTLDRPLLAENLPNDYAALESALLGWR
jgi:threonine synthase